MARFNPDRWKPVDDSSKGYRTLDPRSVVLNVSWDDDAARLGCPCGCGGFPLGRDATFSMGHDARLRGLLIRAHLTGTKVRYHSLGTLGSESDAMEVAEQYGWRHYLEEAVMKREGKNREVLQAALKSERLVKVGRWDYTGQVVAVYRTASADMLEIKYVNRAGDVRTVRVPADEAPLAEEATA